MTSALGFIVRVDPSLVCLSSVLNGFLTFTSGVTPADLLMANMATKYKNH